MASRPSDVMGLWVRTEPEVRHVVQGVRESDDDLSCFSVREMKLDFVE